MCLLSVGMSQTPNQNFLRCCNLSFIFHNDILLAQLTPTNSLVYPLPLTSSSFYVIVASSFREAQYVLSVTARNCTPADFPLPEVPSSDSSTGTSTMVAIVIIAAIVVVVVAGALYWYCRSHKSASNDHTDTVILDTALPRS